MAIPDYQSLMRPVLENAADKEIAAKDVIQKIAYQFQMSDEEIAQTIPSGRTTTLANRVHWAITYMVQAGLLERPRRAVIVATDRGVTALEKHPERIDNQVLNAFAEFRAFKERSRTTAKPETSKETHREHTIGSAEFEAATPEERIEAAADELNTALRQELLTRIVAAHPTFFEHLIIDLMLAMGYGGSGAGKHLGRTADGGVDGIINEDPLGLDIVFLQAKRYTPGNPVSVNQVREFAGTLDERGAIKGVFVTTSNFANSARTYAERSPKRLILIDGDELTRLLSLYGVGVRSFRRLDLKKIDEDYFSNFET